MDVATIARGARVVAASPQGEIDGEVTAVRGNKPGTPLKVVLVVKANDNSLIEVLATDLRKVIPAPVLVQRAKEAEVTNTKDLYMKNPLLGLVSAFEDQRPGRQPMQFIADMEQRGQQELTAQTDKLPKRGSEDPAWAQMGVQFGEEVKGDSLFRYATLPVGWTLKPTDHSLWSELLDNHGRQRATMFYKAAFYDRSAHITLVPRYFISGEYQTEGDYKSPKRSVVKDQTDKSIVLFATEYTSDYDTENAHYNVAKKWLKEFRPQCENAAAYWDWTD